MKGSFIEDLEFYPCIATLQFEHMILFNDTFKLESEKLA